MIEQQSEITKTIFGHFKDNELIDYETGEIISCLTYNIVKKQIENKEGFFNLKQNEWGDWIIFQYVDI